MTIDDIVRAHCNGFEVRGMSDADQREFLLRHVAHLQQQLDTRRPPTVRVSQTQEVETRVVSLKLYQTVHDQDHDLVMNRELSDEQLAIAYAQTIAEQQQQGFKLVNQFPDGHSVRLVFERSTRGGNVSFSMNDLLRELRSLADSQKPWNLMDKLHLRHLPEGFTDWLQQAVRAIDPRLPSGHLLDARETALILMRVLMSVAPDEQLVSSWRQSVARSRETGEGQYECHIQQGVIDRMDNYLTRLGLDPKEE